jgi:hypothetical protein
MILFQIPLFFYFELGGHLGWKSGSPNTVLEWATQGPFHQSLVAIDPVVSEEKIKMTYGRTTAKSDGMAHSKTVFGDPDFQPRWPPSSK